LNENLRRALLRARLSDEDVATHLEVDPKTVRRWLEGRTPYLRHRWALAAVLGQDEADLWPEVRTTQPRPAEVQAIYPHYHSVPKELWQDFFGSAKREIGILADTTLFLVVDRQILATLADRAKVGVQERICLRDPGRPQQSNMQGYNRAALSPHTDLRRLANIQVRIHHIALSSAIYRADDELLISQQVFGIPAAQRPVLHLRQANGSDMATTYLEIFDRIWDRAQPLDWDLRIEGKS